MLIGLMGGKGSGKTTVSNYLINKGYIFKAYAFAEPLKTLCKNLFNLNYEQLEGDLKEVIDPRWGVTPRTLYQKIGTDMFRRHLKNEIPELKCDNIWIKRFEIWYEQNKNYNLLITDARFEDEIKAIKERGGIMILIERETQTNDMHVSEQIHKTYKPDIVIQNDQGLEHLYKRIDEVLSNLN